MPESKIVRQTLFQFFGSFIEKIISKVDGFRTLERNLRISLGSPVFSDPQSSNGVRYIVVGRAGGSHCLLDLASLYGEPQHASIEPRQFAKRSGRIGRICEKGTILEIHASDNSGELAEIREATDKRLPVQCSEENHVRVHLGF